MSLKLVTSSSVLLTLPCPLFEDKAALEDEFKSSSSDLRLCNT